MKYLWVTGMFRSGTTLLAKMFDAHPEVAFASDPYRPFFNDLRDTIAKKNGLLKNNPPHLPLSDYFCDDEQLQMIKLIQSCTLDEKISAEHLKGLKARLRDRGMEFSPFVAKRIDELNGGTYKELFHSMMGLIRSAYGKGNEEMVGSKEVWCNEFTGVLIRAFPDLKIINIVRDPRAVCASRNIVGEKYPWLFLVRQWRKLSIFSWLFSQDPAVAKSLIVIRYEDLVGKPEETAKKMCAFLGINFSPAMVDGTKFRDGDGSAWSQNSSYGTGKEISAKYSEKWKEVLRDDEISLIETLCFHEMKLFGYTPLNKDVERMTKEMVYSPLIVKYEELAEWIKQYSDTRVVANVAEMAKEMARSELFGMDDRTLSRIAMKDEIIEALCISRDYFSHARKTGPRKDSICMARGK